VPDLASHHAAQVGLVGEGEVSGQPRERRLAVGEPLGSSDTVFEGGLLLLLGNGDSPSSELLLLTGRTDLHGSPTGVKTVVAASGASEDLCQTLA
jgi:hypothetical protein